MKPTLLIAALTLAAGSPVAMAKSEVEILRARCTEQELQIRQLEKENAALRAGAEAPAPRKSGTLGSSATTTISTAAPASSIYVVKPGDSVERIARHAGTTPQTLAKLNGLKSGAIIHPGQKLKLPGATAAASSKSERAPAPAAQAATTASASGKTHTVRQGETFYSISRKYGITVKDLAAANPSVKPTALRPGRTLQLSASQTSTTTVSAPPSNAKASGSAIAAASTPTPPKPAAAPAPAPAPPPKPAAEPVSTKPRAITIDTEMTYAEFAKKHGTDSARLNDLNGLDLTGATVLAKGSELYVPSQP